MTASLRYVFWGLLIYILDISIDRTVDGQGWKFDFFNDFIGMLMITWGVWRLGQVNVSPRYQTVMCFVKWVSVLLCLDALDAHFVYVESPFSYFLSTVLNITALIAAVFFCRAMGWLSSLMAFRKSAESWQTTALLFLLVYLVPLGLFYCVSGIAFAMGTSISLVSSIGLVAMLLVPIFALPLLHLFMSTSRMQAEAEALL